jgi:hypothetical protein
MVGVRRRRRGGGGCRCAFGIVMFVYISSSSAYLVRDLLFISVMFASWRGAQVMVFNS